eukprot:symbB.v1.2.035035.t3/scaffold4635.1/size37084/4
MLRRLPELWEMSGPPISVGDAATCSGVLKKVFIHCDTVNDLVTNFLFTKLDRNVVSDELLNLLRERFVSDFSACFPVGCGTSADSAFPFALLLVFYGSGLLPGNSLRDAALELHEMIAKEPMALDCLSIEVPRVPGDVPKIQLNSGSSMPMIRSTPPQVH